MNISSNYNVNYFRFNSKISNNEMQKNTVKAKNPAFKGNPATMVADGIEKRMPYITPTVTEKVIPAVTAAALGIITAASIKPENKTQIPTKEEFQQMLEKDGIVSDKWYVEEWLESYDKFPKETIEFYNLEDIDGNRYAATNLLCDEVNYQEGEYVRSLFKCYSHPELIKQVVNTEDDNGLRIFSFSLAECIVNAGADYPEGLARMLNMRDDYGNLRFQDCDDYISVEIFEKYPEEAEKYAMAKDEMGNYRFNGREIMDIVLAKMLDNPIEKDPDNNDGSYHYHIDKINSIISAKAKGCLRSADIDTVLDLKRNDGSYIFNKLPDRETITSFLDEPELFIEIGNTRRPDRDMYVDNDYIERLVRKQSDDFIDGTKRLLQMPSENEREARFSTHDIAQNPYAAKLYKSAPKTFVSLASLKRGEYGQDGYRFELDDITNIMMFLGNGDKKEFSKEDMKVISDLAKIQVGTSRDNYSYLAGDTIRSLFNIYKKYPQETKEIITKYAIKNWRGYQVVIPDETDIEMYKNDPSSLAEKYDER